MKIFCRSYKKIEPYIYTLSKTKKIRHIPVIIQFHTKDKRKTDKPFIKSNPNSPKLYKPWAFAKRKINSSINKIYVNEPKEKLLIKRLSRIGFKIKSKLPFINSVCGLLPLRNLDEFKKIIEIKKIYYDRKAELTGWINHENPGSTMVYQPSLSSQFTGKGITIAFIDSGVYPHKALMLPRKRILSFKDFINHIDSPYDDNGHGTACIGLACGFLPEDGFIAPAFNSTIVSAKAFDISSHGYYSDILAAMQWILDIKERYNIKILVMPFSSDIKTNIEFDILSIGANKVSKNGILPVASAGNLGPHLGTITSPGSCPNALTVGGFSWENNKPEVLPFSSRGPVLENTNKPDLVMEGKNLTSLNNESNYIKFNGTSASASQAAAIAALLYEKNPFVSAKDIKSIIKVSTRSLGDIKVSQGEGYIDMEKIEEA